VRGARHDEQLREAVGSFVERVSRSG